MTGGCVGSVLPKRDESEHEFCLPFREGRKGFSSTGRRWVVPCVRGKDIGNDVKGTAYLPGWLTRVPEGHCFKSALEERDGVRKESKVREETTR